jgi:hypothetical protein
MSECQRFPNAAAEIIRFPPRRAHCIRLVHDLARGLVIALEHRWFHDSHRAALADAKWLAWNLALPIREIETRAVAREPEGSA